MCVRVKSCLCFSGVAASVLRVASSKGTRKYNKHTPTVYKRENQQSIMESVSSCRDSEGQRVLVASWVKHLPRRMCVAAVHSGIKLQFRVELPVVQGRTTPFSDPEPQAPGLR